MANLPISLPLDSAITSSSVSSPSAPDSDSANDVDHLLEGIDRVRIEDLWSTPRASHLVTRDAAPFRSALFAPPTNKGAIASIMPSASQTLTRCNTTPLPSQPHQHLHAISSNLDGKKDAPFPQLFKVLPCPNAAACLAADDISECFYYHNARDHRRLNVHLYKPHMCRFIDDPAGCRKADRCPFSHNDYERRYHPDRFGKETCRDYLRGDCPRRYCTFKHHVSTKVEVALNHIDLMNDKELLQMVLKISEQRGKALCDKLLRRFGHGKKHSGWKLHGFNPHGRDDQKVKYVTVRVDAVKKALRAAGEKKWAATLKTSSLRDMMSGVRKVAEEIRERCRAQQSYVEAPNCEIHRLIRAVFSNTNWSCHSQEGDNPFLVTPDNQNDAMNALERLVQLMLASPTGTPGITSNSSSVAASKASTPNLSSVASAADENKLPAMNMLGGAHVPVISLGGKQYSTGCIRKKADKTVGKERQICALWGTSDINWTPN